METAGGAAGPFTVAGAYVLRVADPRMLHAGMRAHRWAGLTMSFAAMTLILQTFALVFAALGVFGMFTRRKPPALPTRAAPAATVVVAVRLLVFAVAVRDGWVDVHHYRT
ncbi:hypothetical protein SAMN05216259_11493 [Actinacidiphila guanduensis]|uniref:Uncharacterized protein n=1 Tax=Actinacidiphila guanduensis TaxID=310781 RepID=A0A1H0NJP9_9ACTN|nr:hypothetical protein SAMN05216259_11493 [Actinacidiphila guanduensis]